MKKILAFKMDDSTHLGLKRIADNMRIKLIRVPDLDFSQQISNLVDGNRNSMLAPYTGNMITESMILMCNFSEKELDKLLAAIRQSSLKIDFKAMLTPTNIKWTVTALYFEMEKERAAFLNR